MMENDRFTVLLVDDSDDDRLFVRRALERHPEFAIVGELCDGEEAITYMSGEGVFRDREKHPFPDIMLLDLKLPKKTGHEVLEWMQAEKIGNIFVVVLSGSFLPEDITRSRQLGAHAYFKKEAFEEEQQAMIAEMSRLLKEGVANIQQG